MSEDANVSRKKEIGNVSSRFRFNMQMFWEE